MAAQLVSNVRCQQGRCSGLMHCAAYGERGSNFSRYHRQSYGYHRIENFSGSGTQLGGNSKEHINNGGEKGAKSCTKRGRQQAQKLHRLGFSYLASSFLYIVTKFKAFYNGFLGDVASDHQSRMGTEAPMAEPYFSIPVLPN